MDLRDLEKLLDVEYDQIKGEMDYTLPREKWKHLIESVDSTGVTLLMQAARDGAWECVDLLLRCGSEVNALDKKKRRALDYSVGGNHHEVTLLLLQWDSLLTHIVEGEGQNGQGDTCGNDAIRQLFTQRDKFHKGLKDGESKSLEGTIKGTCGAPRYLVNSRGESALYTAARHLNYAAWAWLRSLGFEYSTKDEKEDMRAYECNEGFARAIGWYFVDIPGCHIQRMVWKSKVYKTKGMDEISCGTMVERYFKEIDKVKFGSEILQTLQDDPSLQIILDFSSTGIECIKPMGKQEKIWGLAELELNRIYVGANETEEFDYSDVVSNLTHELAHKTLAVVFENGGLPYKKVDIDAQEEYQDVICNMMCDAYSKKPDEIIQRALRSLNVYHELIVRVPEIIVKYNVLCAGSDAAEDGFIRLQQEAPELLDFYEKRVVPEIENYIKSNITANKCIIRDLLRTPALLTSYCDEEIQVMKEIDPAPTSKLHEMRALRVSNLKLGVSHLKLSLKEVAFVNWAKYQKTRIFFAKALNRNEIKTLVIIWDEEKKPDFCRRSICNCDCIEKKIGDIAAVTILIVPKKFHVCVCEENSFGYKWSDLSGRTKYWLLKKKLNVGGNSMKLRDIVGCYGGNEERDHMMHELLDEDDISMLIDQKSIYVGRPLKSLLKEKGGELAGKTPDWYIPRSIMIRNMQFSKEVFYARKSDVFIIKNARKSDLERVGIEEACIWDENSAPFEMRCFILTGRRHQEKEDIIFQSIFEKLHNLICQECTGKKWDFIHFFEFKDNIYFHLHSLHLMVIPKSTRYQYSGIDILDCSKIESPLIIADIPGSGKSVFVRETALQMTRKHPNCWIELVELQLFEKIFEEWNESEFISDGNEMDCLYQLIKSSESEFEKKIFNHLCKEKMKFIIIFDGLDEICPKYKEVITSFLEALVSRRNVKVCLTTRTYEMADVEKRLETISFRFLPFSRADQLKYFNNQWNALLRFTPNDKQETKIKAIADNLPVESEISRQIQNFTNEEVGSGTVNFDELAAELIEIGKSMVEGEGNFTATPLHCWMIATVAFEDNFDLNTFKYLPDLYKAFVDIKIRLYCKEKAKEPGLVAGDSLLEGHRSLQYKRLKRFSAYFFLQDKDWELKKEDTDDMLRVGLLTQEGESITFVHRTIGEYLFTLWLLEKAHKERVTSVWMSRVLLEKGFEKVRLFLDSLLRVENEKKSGRGQGEQVKVPYLNQSAFPRREEFLISLQKCMFKCILECNGGIFLYLAENSKAMLPDVIFKEARWDMKILDIEIDRHDENRRWNTLTLCGECIRGRMGMRNSSASHSEFEYLKFLQHMLKMIEEHKLVGHLKEFISNYGLQWMGVDEADLWEEGEGIAQFKLIFEFLVRNKGVLGKILWDTVLGEKGEELLKNSAEYAFDIFEYILESMVEGEQWKESLLEGGNILEAWMCVVRRSGKDGLGRMWWFLEEKLEAVRGGKRRFLRKKDRKNGNALYTACCNESDPNVLPFVWELVRKEFVDEECKDLIFDSFNGVEQNYNFVKNVFHVWLFGLLQEGFLDIDEASRMLHSRNHKDECYLLSFNWHPRSLQKLQELLCTERLRPMDIVKDMESNYMNLTGSCFHPEWIPSFYTDIPSSIVSEWETLLPSLESSPLVDAVPQFDQHGFIPHLSYWDGERFDGFRLKAFLVLLNRKLRLEERILGREELLKRVKGDWFLTHSFFPEMRTRREEEGKTTRAFLIPFFFALISKFLPKERVAEILLHHDSYFGTIFHISLLEGDPMAFLSYYDVARWSMGDRDALWRVHSTIWRGVRGEENTLLEFLLWAQEAAFFTFSENDGCDNQEDLSRSHDVVSCSREESDVEYAELGELIRATRPFLAYISKAKAAKLVRALVDMFLDLEAGIGIEVELCQECIDWAKQERRTFLRQSLEARLVSLYFDTGMFPQALQLGSALLKELKKLDDKNLLVEVQLLESKTYHALSNLPKARAALTSARTTANAIYCPPKLQAALDLQSGILHAADERDFKTAYSYFYEAFEGYDSVESSKALTALKYMLLSKIMLNSPEDVQHIVSGKLALKYAGSAIDAMKEVAQASHRRSLADFQKAVKTFKAELEEDPIVRAHLATLYDTMLEQNLCRIIEPYSRVQVDYISQSIRLPVAQVEMKLSQMILDRKFHGILDQGDGVLVVFEETPVDKTYEKALETIHNMGKVVDTLYQKAKKLS